MDMMQKIILFASRFKGGRNNTEPVSVPVECNAEGALKVEIVEGTGVRPVAGGGTGQASLTDGAFVIGNGTSPVSQVGPGTAGQIPISQGAGNDPVMTALSSDVTMTSGGAVTIANNAVSTAKIADDAVTYAKIQNVSAASRLLGRQSGGGAGDVQEIAANSPISISSSLDLNTNGISDLYLRQGTARTVIGRSANSTGNVADIATTAGKFLGDRGSVLGAFYPTQILSKSSAYPLVTDDYGATVLVTAAATITLPAPATVGSGWWVCIKKTVAAGSDVTIARNASETIDGRSASDVLKAQYAHATYVTDGTNWHVCDVWDFQKQTQASGTSFSASDQWLDGAGTTTGVALGPGIWVLSQNLTMVTNGGSITEFYGGIGTNTGNDGTGMIFGENSVYGAWFAGFGGFAVSPPWQKTLTAATTYYHKIRCRWTVATPQWGGSILAVRIG